MSPYRRALRWAALFTVGFGITASALAVTVMMAEGDPVELGAPDFGDHCREVRGETSQAVLTEDSVYGWACMHLDEGRIVTEPVDPGEACRQQYGGQATARVVSVATNGWRCYGPD